MTNDAAAMPYLKVDNVTKYYGDYCALRDISFEIKEGEFICFLGPSGCGKTTLLRCISGLEVQTKGRIWQAGQDISTLPVSQRDFGIVFQSYALFPNLTVWQNVSYGLVSQGAASREIEARTRELLGLVGLASHAAKYPGQLSGGEQQRVALVRALATSPGLLLLDEPLSALDAKVRAHLRREIRNIQDALGVTTIMVTHDQEEAQTMADRVLVMRGGNVEQIGTPREIYDAPATRFVADFIGVMNFLPARPLDGEHVRVAGADIRCGVGDDLRGSDVECAFRPEDATITANVDENPSAIPTTVVEIEHLGSFERLVLRLDAEGEREVAVDIRKNSPLSDRLLPGAAVYLNLDPTRMRFYSAAVSP